MTQSLLKNVRLIFFWGMVFAFIFAAASLFFPWQYSAQSEVLIISRDSLNTDPYTQIKLSERIGENLTQIIKTSDFYNKVMEAPLANFNKTDWQALNERQQRKKWQKDARGEMVYGTSMMKISAYGSTKEDASALAGAVTQVLVTRGWEYIGNDVTIKIVSAPLASQFPSRPNFALNAIIGFATGIFICGFWVVKYKRAKWAD